MLSSLKVSYNFTTEEGYFIQGHINDDGIAFLEIGCESLLLKRDEARLLRDMLDNLYPPTTGYLDR